MRRGKAYHGLTPGFDSVEFQDAPGLSWSRDDTVFVAVSVSVIGQASRRFNVQQRQGEVVFRFRSVPGPFPFESCSVFGSAANARGEYHDDVM